MNLNAQTFHAKAPSGNPAVIVPWCWRCGREIEPVEMKRGNVICPKCRRRIKSKVLEYPEGTILIRDEKELV